MKGECTRYSLPHQIFLPFSTLLWRLTSIGTFALWLLLGYGQWRGQREIEGWEEREIRVIFPRSITLSQEIVSDCVAP